MFRASYQWITIVLILYFRHVTTGEVFVTTRHSEFFDLKVTSLDKILTKS